jgi:tRNA1(Val) A37 N6-methylase TrmN6
VTTTPETWEDTLLGDRVRLIQPISGYRAAIDPVLLAAAVPAASGERILDLGCGTGAASLCLAARMPDVHVIGLERTEDVAKLAGCNVRINAMDDRVDVVVGDVTSPPTVCAAEDFDHVMINPPFVAIGHGRASPDPAKAASTVDDAGIEAWLTAARGALKPRGTVTLVHRADRLDGILAAFTGFGGIIVYPLWPRADGQPAKRLLVRGVKGSRAPLTLAAGLILHEADGTYSAPAEAVLRAAAAIDLKRPDAKAP